MSTTTSINLGDHFTGFLSTLTQSGRYGNSSEAIRAALRLLEQEERKFEVLNEALSEGEKSGESNISFDDIIAEAEAELHAK